MLGTIDGGSEEYKNKVQWDKSQDWKWDTQSWATWAVQLVLFYHLLVIVVAN